MNMNIKDLLVSGVIFIVIDYFYLNTMKNYFSHQIYLVQSSALKMNYLATLLCYIFLIIGLNYFILQYRRPILDAFILGLVIYGVFETTNKALFSKWKWFSVFIDTLWGGILFALTSYLFYIIEKLI
jgi:uncharacterized membrane protein